MKNKIKFIQAERISLAKNGSLLIWVSKSIVISIHPNYLAKIISLPENKKASGQ